MSRTNQKGEKKRSQTYKERGRGNKGGSVTVARTSRMISSPTQGFLGSSQTRERIWGNGHPSQRVRTSYLYENCVKERQVPCSARYGSCSLLSDCTFVFTTASADSTRLVALSSSDSTTGSNCKRIHHSDTHAAGQMLSVNCGHKQRTDEIRNKP